MLDRIASLAAWCAVLGACASLCSGFRANERAAAANLEAARLFAQTFATLLERSEAREREADQPEAAPRPDPHL